MKRRDDRSSAATDYRDFGRSRLTAASSVSSVTATARHLKATHSTSGLCSHAALALGAPAAACCSTQQLRLGVEKWKPLNFGPI